MSLPGFTGAMATTGEPGFAAGGMDPHRALAVATATGTPLYSCFARRGIYPPNNQAPGSGIRRAAAACMRLFRATTTKTATATPLPACSCHVRARHRRTPRTPTPSPPAATDDTLTVLGFCSVMSG